MMRDEKQRRSGTAPARPRATTRGRVAVALALGLLLASATAALASEGAALYRTHCASCHGVSGRGDGPAAAALKPPPADLTRSALSVPELMKVIDGRRTIRAHGDSAMPVWGNILGQALAGSSRQQLDTLQTERILAEYVRKLESQGATAP